MCGIYGPDCTSEFWFKFMGDAEAEEKVPFQVNYRSYSDPTRGLTPFDPPTRPCNVGRPVCAQFYFSTIFSWTMYFFLAVPATYKYFSVH